MPKFSIVIPVYNKENFLRETLNSVRAQTFTDYEVIAVNDGSNDNSLSILQEFQGENFLLIDQENKGLSRARNSGIYEAGGEYIALLDADDLWLPNHLEKLNELTNKFPRYYLFATAYSEIFPAGNQVLPKLNRAELPQNPGIVTDYFKSSLHQPFINSSCVAFRKEVFLTVGGFDPEVTYSEDTDFFIRANLKYPLVYSPVISSLYRIESENQITRSTISDLTPPDYEKYLSENPNHASLRRFINLRRYFLCNFYKAENRMDLFAQMKTQVSEEVLNKKQQFLLNAPRWLFLSLKCFKNVLLRKGYRVTTF